MSSNVLNVLLISSVDKPDTPLRLARAFLEQPLVVKSLVLMKQLVVANGENPVARLMSGQSHRGE
jgi:hypothetical protein